MSRALRSVALPAVALTIALGLSACGSAGAAPEVVEDDAAMSQEEMEATLPALEADAQRLAEKAMAEMKAGTMSDPELWPEANPAEENHYYGQWTVKDASIDGAGGAYAGLFCLEHRPAEDAEPSASTLYSLKYAAPIPGRTEPVQEQITVVQSTAGVGCV